MMYIDALCYGIDQIPTIPDDIRLPLLERYKEEGLDKLVQELKLLDPEYYKQVDRKNPKRVLHALEVCYMTGHPYSDLRKGQKAERPFRIVRIGLTRPREELYERINRRVDKMVQEGLIEEARRMYPRRGLNSLNTVGMKELFSWMDGALTPDGKPWTVGIVKPTEADTASATSQEITATLQKSDICMATSGNYRNFYIKDGQRYAHTINPHTGRPVQHSLLSATVIAPTCAMADAYATAFMVMGLDKAKALLQGNTRLKAYLIYSDKDNNMQEWHSPTLDKYLKE